MSIGEVRSLEFYARVSLSKKTIEELKRKPFVICGEKEHLDAYEVALKRFFPQKPYVRSEIGIIFI